MADNSDQDKTEQPTPHKLRESRRKGMVLKSSDVLSFSILATTSIIALLYFKEIASVILHESYRLFTGVGRGDRDLIALAHHFFSVCFSALLPACGILIVAVITTCLLQTGFMVSFEPIKPDFQKINPVEGIKKFFTMRLVFELIKTCIKVLLFSGLLCIIFWNLVQDTTSKGALSLGALGQIIHWYGIRLWVGILILMAVFAAIDYLLSSRLYNKQMRMSRHEVREEHKRQEGDPMIRRRLKELQRELASKSRSMSAVKDADFILTNPTHLCVAIRYRPEIIDAPVVIAKGAGQQAKTIREIAGRYNVPIFPQKRLARNIFFKTKVGQPIDPEYFSEIARVMHRAGLLRKKIKK